MLIVAAITIVVVLLVIRIAIPIVGLTIANKILPDLLNTDASIGFVNMALLRGRVSSGEILIKQPDGFEDGTLFSLGNVAINIDLPSLKNGPITVESIVIDDIELNIIRGTNGIMNLASLVDSSTTNAPTTNETTETSPAESPAVGIKTIKVSNLTFSYVDLSYDPPLVIQIEDLNLTITNILFDPKQTDSEELITSLDLTALFKQTNLHDAFIGITAKLGVLGTNIPAANAAIRIGGFELDLIKPALPPAISTTIATTLGGSCIDVYTDVSVSEKVWDLLVQIKTADNTMRYAEGGTLSNRKIDTSTALGNVVTRPGAIIGGLVGNAGGAGIKVIEGAGKTTATVGEGTIKVIEGLGKGLFETAKGVATADLVGIKDGLLGTTVGTIKETASAVVDTANTAINSIGDVATSATGKDNTDAWRAGCEERWQKLWDEAQQKVESAPYPHPKTVTK